MSPGERYAEFKRLLALGDWKAIAAWQESERQGILTFVADLGGGVGAPRLPEPSPEAIEAAAKILYSIGNVRVGLRIWDDVKEHYLREAEAALRAAYAVDGVGA